MEKAKFRIDIYHIASKFLNATKDHKLNIIFNLLILKNSGFINSTPLLKFAGLIDIELQLLKDKISAVKYDDDIFPLTAKYKMMAKYGMISPEFLEILREQANYKLDYIYKHMDLESQERIIYRNLSDIQLN